MNLNSLKMIFAMALMFFILIQAGGVSKTDASEKIVLKLATATEAINSCGMGFKKFADLVRERSNGMIEVEVYYSGILGMEGQTVRNMQAGTIEISTLTDANLSAFTKSVLFIGMPFIFNDSDSLRKVINTKWVRDFISSKLGEEKMKVLMIFNNGGGRRIHTVKRLIKVPDDMKGLKIRIPASPIETAIMSSFGALPTPIAWAETYTALSQGTADGEGIQWTWTVSTKHYEVVKYTNDVEYVIPVYFAIMRLDYFKSLPPDIQELLVKAAKDAEEYQVKLDQEMLITAKKILLEKGIKIYETTKEEKIKWHGTAAPVWEKFKSEVSLEFLRKIREMQ